MTSSFTERELKLDVDEGFLVGDVTPLLPYGSRLESTLEELRSDYYDTADHALLSADMTLRHRTGTTDNGWQLKIPEEPFRQEIRVDDTDPDNPSDGIPDELARLLLGACGGRPLVHIATLRTERTATRLLDRHGRGLAEIDDDTVHSILPGHQQATTWREVEIELAGDDVDVDLLYLLGKWLRDGGARPAQTSSKLSRALAGGRPETRGAATAGGPALDLTIDAAAAGTPDDGAGDSAGVLAAYIAEQRRVLLAGDIALRRGDDTAIHKTRVATRRLRSTARTFAALVDEDRAASLDTELRWFAGLMGQIRDRQVLLKRLDAMVDDLDDTLVLGPVRVRIHRELDQERAEHWQHLQQALTGERYLALLADIAGWVRRPPWTPDALEPASTIRKPVRKAERKVARRLERANESGDVEELHRARKAAKRARYAAEAAEPVLGPKAATKEAARYEKLQDLLGEHQDSLVSAEVLRRLGAKAGTTPGENGFTFGVLYEREQHNGRVARAEARRQARKYAR